MEEIGILTLIIIIINGLVTYKGLKDYTYLNKYSFKTDRILVDKDYKRLFTSGFLHVDWMHFIFNMMTLYFFSEGLESYIGIPAFFALYFSSLLGGNLLALYIHRNHYDYSAIGASGAVCGLVFASIGLFPGMIIGFILLPISIPAWIFGIGYILYTIYGIKAQRDNIGREAHLDGGIVGLLVACALKPGILNTNYPTILLILIPSLTFLILIIKMPHLLIIQNPFSKSKTAYTFEDKYNTAKATKQTELDKLLDKINEKGYDKLSKKVRERLNELSK